MKRASKIKEKAKSIRQFCPIAQIPPPPSPLPLVLSDYSYTNTLRLKKFLHYHRKPKVDFIGIQDSAKK